MYWTLANFEVTDRAATDNDEAAIQGVGDVVDAAGHHMLYRPAYLLAVASFGISTSRVRLDAPSLTKIGGRLDVWPFNRAAIPASYASICRMMGSPVQFQQTEPIAVLHSGNGVTGTNENWTTVLFFGDGNYRLPAGPTLQIQVTGATTQVANTWTNCPLTMAFTLNPGTYAVVGASFFGTNAQAFRMRFPGQDHPGGGGICTNNNLGQVGMYDFWEGRLGVLGTFSTMAPPSVEMLSNAADTAQTGFLRLVRISDSLMLPSS